MFTIDATTHEIKLTQGNTCVIDTEPFVKKTGEPIILSEGDKILFIVKSATGRECFKKILTSQDYDEENNITFTISPEDTLSLEPYVYLYDLLLIFADGSAYTYIDTAQFCLLPAIGTIKDLVPRGEENGN